ncbi:PREDICTED: trypsin-like [Ceratosolen solmsi marchali]|uniref:Trypsin-like n=1 Tax=Ceratosolen solmsi marchali TaxID=326594 RepID=A0AAJ6YNV1_9HYME|nr:PREDICTED: trypsin-like [Ceratosolen solmsi marchali]
MPSGTMHHFCAGTLISSQDVITAAQCLDGKKAINLRVILGSVDLNFDGHYYVNYWVTYKNWAIKKNIVVDTDKHEIAIIRLSREVNSQIKPAVISFLSHSEYVGKVAELAGWGISNDNEMPTTMETVKVEVLSNAECETRSERLGAPKCRFPARYLFTAANPYAQLSSGDSGGPLLLNKQLIGVNHGTCLIPEQIFHSEKINLHFGVMYYQHFITNILTEYK